MAKKQAFSIFARWASRGRQSRGAAGKTRAGSAAKPGAAETLGPRVLHRYGRFEIVYGPQPAGKAASRLAANARLTQTERAGIAAFKLATGKAQKGRRRIKAPSIAEHTAKADLRDTIYRGKEVKSARKLIIAKAAPSVQPNNRLIGKVAVGTIFVAGTHPGLPISNGEIASATGQIQSGLTWLQGLSDTANVEWLHDVQAETINVSPDYSGDDYEPMERPWRDPALLQLTGATGATGIAKLGAPRVIVLMVTKYPAFHYASALPRNKFVAMSWAGSGGMPGNFAEIVAHESAHLFGAPDEYSPCGCGGSHGFFSKPNRNCESCAPGGGESCIMRDLVRSACPSTLLHLGFPDAPGQ